MPSSSPLGNQCEPEFGRPVSTELARTLVGDVRAPRPGVAPGSADDREDALAVVGSGAEAEDRAVMQVEAVVLEPCRTHRRRAKGRVEREERREELADLRPAA